MKGSVIICAAGKGTRAGFGRNKLLVPLYGAPALYYTIKAFADFPADEIIIAASPEDKEEIKAIASPYRATVVDGGATRAQSVKNALNAVSGEIVLIHDGARPFVTNKIISDCIECVKTHRSAICSLPATDTVILSDGGESVADIPPRGNVFTVQTPQGFYTEDIKNAYTLAQNSGKTFTDDGSVYTEYIAPAHLFTGDLRNRKLTYRNDFIGQYPPLNAEKGQAIGIGADVHAFGKKQSFVTLCGVKIPCDSGLVAHSDGDAAAHAVMDALLSAAGLKDIGHYFPDGDPQFAGADSMKLLRQTVKLVFDAGYTPLNVTVTVQAEKPRLAAYIGEMAKNLAAACNLAEGRTAVSAGTCEKLGFVGEGKGICATAVALLADVKG